MGFIEYLLWVVVRDNAVPTMKSLTTRDAPTPHNNCDSLLSW